MVHGLLFITLSLAFVSKIRSQPLDFLPKFHFDGKTDRSWLWSWAWGAENTVAIVDRSPAVSFPSRPAAFGTELTSPLLGYVIPLSSFTVSCSDFVVDIGLSPNVTASPNLGCPRLCKIGQHQPERTDTWIALVQRGKCEFVSKVREAQRLGAKAVVVGGDDPAVSGNPDILVNMYSPSMFLFHSFQFDI
jgi:E3 ubiquitin-protein ligase RNF13/E3 ubiquitin-protein ligase RNF167